MRAGPLRHRVIVEEAVDTQNDTGEPVRSWALLTHQAASIQGLRGRERLTGEQIIADMDTKITVRWSSLMDGLTAKHRLRHGSTVYNIVEIVRDATLRRQLDILCKSGANDG